MRDGPRVASITIRFYDHYDHVSAAVCYQNTLHARTGDGRLDHARTHVP